MGPCGEVRQSVHYLHDGRQERLRVEEAGQPDGGGQVEVRGPALQLLVQCLVLSAQWSSGGYWYSVPKAQWPMFLSFHLDPEQEVCVPGGETVERGVGKLRPGRGHLWWRVRGLSRPALIVIITAAVSYHI